jgi:acetolactate synthase-1/2/3 large subunit
MAIGVKSARPELPVVCLSGDGGFRMSGVEVETALQKGVGVIFVILNDGKWGMCEQGIKIITRGTTVETDLGRANVAGVARAYGVSGRTVRSVSGFRRLFSEALSRGGDGRPTVLDVRIDPREGYWPNFVRVPEHYRG